MSYLFFLYQNLTDQKKRDSEKKRICTGIVHRRILSKGFTLLRGCWVWSKKLRFRKNFNAMTPVARLNLKKSLILWTFSRTLSFQFLFYCVLFCGLLSGFMTVSWRATRDSLLSWRATRGVVKCWEYGGKFAEKSFVLFTRILGFLWHYLKKILRI